MHHNNKFDDLNNAVNKEQGLAVLGIFFKVNEFNICSSLQIFLMTLASKDYISQVGYVEYWID